MILRTRFALPFLAVLVAARPATAQQVGPVIVDGQAQVVEAFSDSTTWIREHLWVETEFDSDGDGRPDRMHVDVTRPAATASGLRLPVIYETSPYFAGTSGDRAFMWDVRHEVGAPPPPRTSQPHPGYDSTRTRISNSLVRTWVPRGFVVVHSESPGTGRSQGCPTVGGRNEELAPKSVIDWLNGRARGFTAPEGGAPVVADWSTGKVGMTGTSYNGTLPIAAAVTGVEGLEAIIPDAANTSYWHYYRANGLVRHPGGWMGEDIDFLYDFIHSGDPARRAYCDATVRDGEMAAGRDRTTGDWNAFWAARDYWLRLDGIHAATLLSHGLGDWNVMPSHSTHVYEVLRTRGVPTRLYLHQGGHGGPPPLELMNRWFTRFLFGVENGVEHEPGALIVREGAPRTEPTPYATWPNPEAAPVTMRLTAGGNAVGGLTIAAVSDQGIERLADDAARTLTDLAGAPESSNRLLYATAPLAEPLHLSGTPTVTVRMAADRPAVNLSVYLVQLPWVEGEGRLPSPSIVTRGWADLRNHASLEHEEPLVPGEFVSMTFGLEPDDQIIPAGARLALMVFSSDGEHTLLPPAGARLSLDLDGTRLELPVVGGAPAFAVQVP
ncbi:MAG TPA: Xaa-Pro dipeptidyl-peptidase [Gemmatimonadales bacterium]|nr:Xaa-Pro dipeptidyl-peptidase [Gemmatimonadales bacterium]